MCSTHTKESLSPASSSTRQLHPALVLGSQHHVRPCQPLHGPPRRKKMSTVSPCTTSVPMWMIARLKGTCFKCGQPGHYIADCPAWNGNNPKAIRPSLPGRVHHISAEEAREDSDVVLGTCTINTKPALVLFDSGGIPLVYLQKFCCKASVLCFPFGPSFGDTNPCL